MSLKNTELFKIEGAPGTDLDRVRSAMQWLTSSAAENIGTELLQKAHDRTHKPLTIIVTDQPALEYSNEAGEHTIYINPQYADTVRFSDQDGEIHPLSLEQMLAHELVHASQDLAHQENMQQTSEMLIKLHREKYIYAQQHPSYDAKEVKRLCAETKSTAYFGTAANHIEKLLNITDHAKSIADRYVETHPDYIRHIERYEAPALEIEQRIAKLRNEPFRTNYNYTFRVDSSSRDADRQDYYAHFNMGKKHGLPPTSVDKDMRSWREAVNNEPHSIKLKQWEPEKNQHPLIAQHRPGGKS